MRVSSVPPSQALLYVQMHFQQQTNTHKKGIEINSADMGKAKNSTKPLTDAEIWDDSALVRTWDEAFEEYKVSRDT